MLAVVAPSGTNSEAIVEPSSVSKAMRMLVALATIDVWTVNPATFVPTTETFCGSAGAGVVACTGGSLRGAAALSGAAAGAAATTVGAATLGLGAATTDCTPTDDAA